MQIRPAAATPTAPPAAAPPPAPASPAAAAADSVSLSLSQTLRRGARFLTGVAGAAAGAVAGAAAGTAVGAGLGTALGIQGGNVMELDILQPLHSVAGLGGVAAHRGAEKWAGRLLGARAGRIAGAVAGGVVGAATGAVIGAVGMAVAGADAAGRLALRGADAVLGPPESRPDTDPRPSYERGRGPQVPTPDGIIDRDQHHWYYLNAAMPVLAHDATRDPFMGKVWTFLSSSPDYLNQLQMGAWNMDTFLGAPVEHVNMSTFHHFEEPFVPGFKSAGWQSRQAYDKAVDCWKAGDRKLAMYYLGAAVHLAQDVSLPQHAATGVGFVGKMVGHQMMERWCETQAQRLNPPANAGGIYLQASGPEDFVAQVAAQSDQEYREAVKDAARFVGHRREKARQGLPTDIADQTDFRSPVYENAWQRAVRLTPGFYAMFFRDVEAQGYPI